jgi:hypothetical protein
MSKPRLIRAMTAAAVAILSILLAGAAPSAASADTTPPSTPVFGYAQGFYCLTLIIGVPRSTDNVTPQSQIVYRVIANGVDIGALSDRGADSGVWAVLQLPQVGTNTVTVQAVDLAGNRSTSRAVAVTGYYTPGCTPGHI